MATILLAYSDFIFFTTHPSLVLQVSRILSIIYANATLASNISTWSTSISLVWQILKTSTMTCLFIIIYLSPNITLILLCSGSNFQVFKNKTRMLWQGVFHSISNRPINLALFAQGFFFFSKACPKQNVPQIAIITLLYWSKEIPKLIILISTHFFPTQICNHYLQTCSLYALLIGNMNFLWNLLLSVLLLM